MPLLFIVIFAVIGVGYLVYSRADTLPADPQPTRPQPIADTSKDPFIPNLAVAANNGQDLSKGSKVAQYAYNELGNGNQSKYGQPGAWCAAFAIWTWKQAGLDTPKGMEYHNVDYLAEWGKKKGKWSKHPTVGSMAIYGKKRNNGYEHVGIVVRTKGNKVQMIDGNWGNRVAYHASKRDNSGSLFANYRSFYTGSTRIDGFINP